MNFPTNVLSEVAKRILVNEKTNHCLLVRFLWSDSLTDIECLCDLIHQCEIAKTGENDNFLI